MLITNEFEILTISATSLTSSDIIGDPPIARIAFAQSFTVTKFVIQWVSGVFLFTSFNNLGNFFKLFF